MFPALDDRGMLAGTTIERNGLFVKRTMHGCALGIVGLALLLARPAGAFPLPLRSDQPLRTGCPRAAVAPVIDGRLDDAAWSSWIRLDTDIEGPRRPAPRFGTDVAMAWDDSFLYVGARLVEPHVWATYARRDMVVYHENDFEVFIDPDGDNHLYYELEINALGTVWDLLLVRPYRDGTAAVDAWDVAGLKSAVQVQGTLNDPSDLDEGWTVELAFPWAVLAQVAGRPAPPAPGDVWRVNFSRVEWRTQAANGGYVKAVDAATGQPLPEDNWVWSPQGLIAMHYPERWGQVVFLGEGQAEQDAMAGNAELEAIKLAGTLMHVYYRQKEFQEVHGRYAADLAELGLDAHTMPGLTPGLTFPLGADQELIMTGGPDWFHARLTTPVVTATVDHEGWLRRLAP